jgi:glutathione reductase (NADPH)
MTYDFDLFVIGGGSGGVRAARISAGYGAKVGLAEEYRLGGTCVIRGCVPKKLMVYAAHFSDLFEDAAGYGWQVGSRTFDWPTLIANKDKEIARLEAAYAGTLERAGVETFASRAEILDQHNLILTATGQRISAERILIATGGHPSRPKDLIGIEHTITSNEVFHLPEFPKRIAILGGGYVAVEFAGIFHGLGSQVTQIYRGEKFLRGFDDDLRQGLADAMTGHGIDLRFNTHVQSIEAVGDMKRLTLPDGTTLEVDQVLIALGREPNVMGLGLDRVGIVQKANGAIAVDDYSQTNVENIYAVGDVTDRLALTPIAIAEGHAFADTVFGGRKRMADHRNVATAVFSHPPIGTIGLGEAEALAAGHRLDIYSTSFRPMFHTMTGRPEKIFMKLVVDADSDVVLGCHILGSEAGEIIQMAAIAIKMGAKKSDFDATVAVHPTAAEEFVTMRQKSKAGISKS